VKVKALIQLLQTLNQDMDVYVAITEENGEVLVEEVTESCDDPTIIGYMIADASVLSDKVN
jgi:hypothetical protein